MLLDFSLKYSTRFGSLLITTPPFMMLCFGDLVHWNWITIRKAKGKICRSYGWKEMGGFVASIFMYNHIWIWHKWKGSKFPTISRIHY